VHNNRSRYENTNLCLGDTLAQLHFHIKHLKQLMQAEHTGVAVQMRSYGHWKIVKEPYGVVCIIAPWNFPFQLLFNPLVSMQC
jgi:aldehyde dehydrogenase (NAD+)